MCKIEKVFDEIIWDSVIKSLCHGSTIDSVFTVEKRLQNFLLAKISLIFPENKCEKEKNVQI